MSLIFLRLHPSVSSLRNRICFDEGAVQLFSLVRFSLHCNIACCFSSIAAVRVSALETKLGIYNPEKDLAKIQSQISNILYFRKEKIYLPRKSVCSSNLETIFSFCPASPRKRRPKRARIAPPRRLSRPCVSDLLRCIRPKAGNAP
jgi:hypothetical protein